jgi:hypothetical protein
MALRTISSILNRKATGQHSPLSRAPLDSKDLTIHFHRKAPDVIRNSFEINSEYDARPNWRAV